MCDFYEEIVRKYQISTKSNLKENNKQGTTIVKKKQSNVDLPVVFPLKVN